MNRRAIVRNAVDRWWAMHTGTPESCKLALRLVPILSRIMMPLPQCTLRALYEDARLRKPHRAMGGPWWA